MLCGIKIDPFHTGLSQLVCPRFVDGIAALERLTTAVGGGGEHDVLRVIGSQVVNSFLEQYIANELVVTKKKTAKAVHLGCFPPHETHCIMRNNVTILHS